MQKKVFETNTVNHSTGEITTTRTITKEVLNTAHFVKTYIEDIGALAKCSGAEQSVVLSSLKYLNYNTNEILINSSRRADIALNSNLKANTVNMAISRLVKKNIFIKAGNCSYTLNPTLFFYGDDLARLSTFKLCIKYELKQE